MLSTVETVHAFSKENKRSLILSYIYFLASNHTISNVISQGVEDTDKGFFTSSFLSTSHGSLVIDLGPDLPRYVGGLFLSPLHALR